MSQINLESLTQSTFVVETSGKYNVDVEVDHTYVGITIAYGHELHNATCQYFYHGVDATNQQATIKQTFPNDVSLVGLKDGGVYSKVWIFTFLVMTHNSSRNGTITVGPGAGAAKDIGSGEAADILVENYSGGSGELPKMGSFPSGLLRDAPTEGGQTRRWASHKLGTVLQDAPGGYKISIPSKQVKGKNKSLLEQGVHLIVLDTGSQMRGIIDAYNPKPIEIPLSSHPSASEWSIIALVSAQHNGKDFLFQVGDPEKDSRVNVLGPR